MIPLECHIKFTTHSVHICVDQELIYVFKYTNTTCSYESFTTEYEAADFIFKQFDPYQARVVVYDYLGNEAD